MKTLYCVWLFVILLVIPMISLDAWNNAVVAQENKYLVKEYSTGIVEVTYGCLTLYINKTTGFIVNATSYCINLLYEPYYVNGLGKTRQGEGLYLPKVLLWQIVGINNVGDWYGLTIGNAIFRGFSYAVIDSKLIVRGTYEIKHDYPYWIDTYVYWIIIMYGTGFYFDYKLVFESKRGTDVLNLTSKYGRSFGWGLELVSYPHLYQLVVVRNWSYIVFHDEWGWATRESGNPEIWGIGLFDNTSSTSKWGLALIIYPDEITSQKINTAYWEYRPDRNMSIVRLEFYPAKLDTTQSYGFRIYLGAIHYDYFSNAQMLPFYYMVSSDELSQDDPCPSIQYPETTTTSSIPPTTTTETNITTTITTTIYSTIYSTVYRTETTTTTTTIYRNITIVQYSNRTIIEKMLTPVYYSVTKTMTKTIYTESPTSNIAFPALFMGVIALVVAISIYLLTRKR